MRKNLKAFLGTVIISVIILVYPAMTAQIDSWWWVFITPVVTVGAFCASVYLFNCVEQEDLSLAEQFASKTGIPVDRVVRKLMR